MAQLLQHSIPTSRSFGWAPCDWHRARDSEENCPSAIKCPHLPPSPALARGTAAGCALAASIPHPASPALPSQLPDTSNSSSRFPQSPSSCTYILMPAVPLQAALVWTTTVPPTWDGASVWHCRVGMEHTCGTNGQTACMHGIDGQAENTRMALMDRLGACRSLIDREHRYGTDGPTEHTCGTHGQTGATRVAVMD